MILREARHIATNLCYTLQPFCAEGRIKIAGSVRRNKPEVHDLEIVLQPKTEFVNIDLFDNQKEVRVPEFAEIVATLGRKVKGTPEGKMMQIVLPQNIVLDLFMPEPRDFFRQYAIRTGSALFSQKILASGWGRIGWCGSDQGLRKKIDCVGAKDKQGKISWKCVNPRAEKPPAWKNEEDFFMWLGVKYVPPEARSMY